MSLCRWWQRRMLWHMGPIWPGVCTDTHWQRLHRWTGTGAAALRDGGVTRVFTVGLLFHLAMKTEIPIRERGNWVYNLMESGAVFCVMIFKHRRKQQCLILCLSGNLNVKSNDRRDQYTYSVLYIYINTNSIVVVSLGKLFSWTGCGLVRLVYGSLYCEQRGRVLLGAAACRPDVRPEDPHRRAVCGTVPAEPLVGAGEGLTSKKCSPRREGGRHLRMF